MEINIDLDTEKPKLCVEELETYMSESIREISGKLPIGIFKGISDEKVLTVLQNKW